MGVPRGIWQEPARVDAQFVHEPPLGCRHAITSDRLVVGCQEFGRAVRRGRALPLLRRL